MNGQILLRIRLGLLRGAAVHLQGHDLFAQNLFVPKNLDRVAVALAHFLAVRARDRRHLLANDRLRQDKCRPVGLIEFDGDVTRDFHVLLLVPPDRHDVGIVKQDVRRHQHGVGKDAVIGAEPAGDFILVAGASLQQSHWR